MIYWIVAGTLVILILSAVAAALHYKLYRKRQKEKALLQQWQEKEAEARDQMQHSIQVIARAYMAEQVECAEACLRVSRLMDQLGVEASVREPFVAIDKMTASIEHIPVLDAWNALSKQERRDHRAHIETRSGELEDFVKPAMQKLTDHQF